MEQENIEDRIIEIYEEVKRKIDEQEINSRIEDISYYKNLNAINKTQRDTGGGVDLSETYVVRMVDGQERVLYEIYDDNMLIATMDENGKMTFSDEYKQTFLEIENGQVIVNQINTLEHQLVDIEEPEGLKEQSEKEDIDGNKIVYSQAKIEEIKANKEKQKDAEVGNNEIDDEIVKSQDEEEKIAAVMGLDKSDIVAKSKINPHSFITERESFEEAAGIEGMYETVYVVNSNSKTDKNKKFAFIGITPEGKPEYIEKLKTRGTTRTDRSVYSINRDGSAVEEVQTTEMFEAGDRDKSFSVTIGQYGILDVNYLRRSASENKFIGSKVETQYERPTRKQVRDFMDDNRNSKYDINDAVKRTEHQLEENQSDTTKITNIDKNKNNDQALDSDEKITLHDNTTTTLKQEAARLGLDIEYYKWLFERTEGDCASDKIDKIRISNEKVTEQENDKEELAREEMETPEEAALRRMEQNQSIKK